MAVSVAVSSPVRLMNTSPFARPGGPAPHRADPLPRALRLLRLPVVFGGPPGNLTRGVHVVDFDNSSGARLAVEYLLGSGRRRIATVARPQGQTAARHRLSGRRETLRAAGHEPADLADLAEEADFTLDGGRAAMERLLDRHPDLDAVFVSGKPIKGGPAGTPGVDDRAGIRLRAANPGRRADRSPAWHKSHCPATDARERCSGAKTGDSHRHACVRGGGRTGPTPADR
ncbi:substrate-binding domain-containing protein [Amycolatopsis taiwanensis]|uniref:substrate-binding domain-containing protein n=1 Tax=Amycolatopsis taiwanensis TaxID=342230 RepID=UPI003D7FD036